VPFRESRCTSRTSEVKWRPESTEIFTALSRIARLLSIIASFRERQAADDEGRRGKEMFAKLRHLLHLGSENFWGEVKCGSLFKKAAES
jgi:hypothetical protein